MKATVNVKLVFALLGVAIIWGTTYLGIRIAVKKFQLGTLPPLGKPSHQPLF